MIKYALSTMYFTVDLRGRYFLFHFGPGLLVATQGYWLALNVLRRYYRDVLSDGQEPFESQLWYPGPFTKYLPIESVVRGILTIIATALMTWSCCMKDFEVSPESTQHAILFFSMFISAFFEVLASRHRHNTTTQYDVSLVLPPHTDRAAAVLSSIVAFFVFYFHFHNEAPLQLHMHKFFTWFAAMLVCSHVAEVLGRKQVWMSLARPYVLLTMGQWDMQIGFVLYFPISWPRNWDDETNLSILTANFLVCCHLVIAFIFLMVIAVFARQRELSRRSQPYLAMNIAREQQQLLKNSI